MSDKDDNALLRIGRYRPAATSEGLGVERPFVYVPEGFDLARDGALGEILKAAGVYEILGQSHPSGVFVVPKQGPHVMKLEEAAAARISQLAVKREKRFGAAEVDEDEADIYKKTTAQSSGERAGGDA